MTALAKPEVTCLSVHVILISVISYKAKLEIVIEILWSFEWVIKKYPYLQLFCACSYVGYEIIIIIANSLSASFKLLGHVGSLEAGEREKERVQGTLVVSHAPFFSPICLPYPLGGSAEERGQLISNVYSWNLHGTIIKLF